MRRLPIRIAAGYGDLALDAKTAKSLGIFPSQLLKANLGPYL
jgi:hypothetical protein